MMPPADNLQANNYKIVNALRIFEAMRWFSLFLCLIIQSAILKAQQNLNVNWGDEQVFDRSINYNRAVGTKDTDLYVISSSGQEPQNSIDVILNVYDKEKLQLKNTLQIVDNKSPHGFEELIIAKDKILIFNSYYDRQLSLKILTVQEYDKAGNSLSTPERIDEVHVDVKDQLKPFHISVSADGNYILIYHDNPSSSGNKIFNLKVLNYDFTSLWKKEFELNYKEKMVDFKEFKIDNYSNVYLLSSINPFGLSKSSGIGALVNVKSALFVYRPSEDKLKEYEFTLSRNWIDDVKLSFDENQFLIATAFYTYPNDYKIRGFVIFELNSEIGEVVMKKMITLDKNDFSKVDKTIGRLKDYSRAMVGSPGIYPGGSSHMNSTSTKFYIKDLYTDHKNIVLAIEAIRLDERCTESFNDQQMIVDCQKNFLYGDVLLFFLDRKSELKQITTIPKIQHSLNKLNPHFSYGMVANENSVLLIFNDDVRNLENTSAEKVPLSNINKATMSIAAFNQNGVKVELEYTHDSEDKIPFFPSGNIHIGQSEYLLYSQNEKNYKFGKVSIK